MASALFSSSVLKAKFRGCMIGALLGDCLGAPFEFQRPPKEKLLDLVTNLMSGDSSKILSYTDDTAMTLAVASSLVDKGEVNAKDMAERFATDFYTEKKNRGYGTYVRLVFQKLLESDFKDVFMPATEQFNGLGSYGNGGAMRIAPIALFGNRRGEEYVMNAAKTCALITHAHQDGYNGAILQCLAVSAAFELDSSQELDPVNFINNLLEKMETIETEDSKPYCESLNKVKTLFLQNQEDISSEEIAECLGNGSDVSALKSVPSAIYLFLRCMKPLKNDFENPNPFIRTICFAISLGGDTDTIATMAGALAGAYYGEEIIPDAMQKRCESIDEVISVANKLFDVSYKKGYYIFLAALAPFKMLSARSRRKKVQSLAKFFKQPDSTTE